VASICEAAGFSRGLIGHYFKSKDDLLYEAIHVVKDMLGNSIGEAVDSAGDDPVAKLHAIIRASFSPPGFTLENASVWIALTATARWNPKLQAIYSDLWKSFRRRISTLLNEAAKNMSVPVDSEMAALTLSQLIEGLWVGYLADPISIDPARAENACHSYLDLLFSRQHSN
jgi:AcrR family transcriptional regulator